jgi:hypothetical protein
MFRVLLAHPQEALHKRHLVYCVHFMSVGCTRIGVELQSWCSTQYTKCRCAEPPENEQVMLERPLILNKLNKKSRGFHYTDISKQYTEKALSRFPLQQWLGNGAAIVTLHVQCLQLPLVTMISHKQLHR